MTVASLKDEAWRAEIERSVEEIESGKVKAIPSTEVFKEARGALNQARRMAAKHAKSR